VKGRPGRARAQAGSGGPNGQLRYPPACAGEVADEDDVMDEVAEEDPAAPRRAAPSPRSGGGGRPLGGAAYARTSARREHQHADGEEQT